MSNPEPVYTFNHYEDRPRAGIASFEGKPHFYHCIFDEELDSFTDGYFLKPISQEQFERALREWKVFEDWKTAYLAGKASFESKPVFEGTVVEREMDAFECQVPNEVGALKVRGHFKTSDESQDTYKVLWSPLA